MTEDDGLSRAPVLVVQLRSVFRVIMLIFVSPFRFVILNIAFASP